MNHNNLIEHIKELSIEGTPLRWLISLFTDRTSSVKINDFISPPNNISSGVPQDSVLGPLLFCIYLRPLSNIINKFSNVSYHMYSDDIQLIIKLSINSPTSNLELLKCTSEIMNLLLTNDHLVNTSKTELLNAFRILTIFPSVIIYGKLIHPSDSVHNFGVIMDSSLSFGHHMNAISKSVNYHLRRIAHNRKYYSCIIYSRIDYGGSLFSDSHIPDGVSLFKGSHDLSGNLFRRFISNN